MPFGILNNIPALQAEGALQSTQKTLSSTLGQLSTGKRINAGSDDPAGLAIANGLSANIAALNQSDSELQRRRRQPAGSRWRFSQVTSLLNTAVTIATEASTGTVSSSQRDSLNSEYQQILAEITQIGTTTDYNGTAVFNGATTSIYLTDGTNASPISTTIAALTTTGLGLNASTLAGTDGTAAQTALTAIDAAVQTVANDRGTIGASVNRLQYASSVMTTEVQNLTAAENNIMAADIPKAISSLSNLSVLSQTGMAALAQANSQQQSILKLLQ